MIRGISQQAPINSWCFSCLGI
ncbi:hypothetical protein CP8484711_0770A, partial [Chlamydia psittaci 84-8471/1]